MHRMLRVARTTADPAGSTDILGRHGYSRVALPIAIFGCGMEKPDMAGSHAVSGLNKAGIHRCLEALWFDARHGILAAQQRYPDATDSR